MIAKKAGLGTFNIGDNSITPGENTVTTVVVNNLNTGYTVQPTDDLIMFDGSAGSTLLSVTFEGTPRIGKRVTCKWWKWASPDGTTPPPLVRGGGNQIEPFNNPGGANLGTQTNITVEGQAGTWEYDGTEWVLVG